MNISNAEIERIVREVLKSVAQPAVASPMPREHAMNEAVVSLASLRGVPAGTVAIRLPDRAIVTPSAREWCRDHAITLLVGSSLANLPSVSTAMLKPTATMNPTLTPRPVRMQDTHQPARLFVTGSVAWMPSLAGQLCPRQTRIDDRQPDDASAIRSIATAIRQGHALGLAVVDAPHSALWQAARDDALRPAVVSQWSDLNEIFREVPTNTLIVSSIHWNVAGAANIARRFLSHSLAQS